MGEEDVGTADESGWARMGEVEIRCSGEKTPSSEKLASLPIIAVRCRSASLPIRAHPPHSRSLSFPPYPRPSASSVVALHAVPIRHPRSEFCFVFSCATLSEKLHFGLILQLYGKPSREPAWFHATAPRL